MTVDYDSWKLESPYDCPTLEGLSDVQRDDLPNFDDTRDLLKGIWEALYHTGDVEHLEKCLEELYCQFDLEFNLGSPQLESKHKNKLMSWYIGYQQATIDRIRGLYDS